MKSQDIIKWLKYEGWEHVSTNGSHHKFKHPSKPGIVIVPHPKKDLTPGTVQAICRQAGWK